MLRPAAQNLLLPVSLGALCLGIIAGRHFYPAVDKSLLLPVFLLACLLFRLALRACPPKKSRLLLAVGLLFIMAGMLRYSEPDLTPAPNHAYHLFTEPERVSFVAEVTGLPVVKNDILQFEARLLDIATPGKWRRTTGLVRFSMPADAAAAPMPPGRMFLGRGKISRIIALQNPGAFDYSRFLAQKGIFLKGWIDSPASLQVVEAYPKAGMASTLPLWPEKIRYRIHRFLNRALPPLQAALYSAILIGDRSALPAAVVENFKASGAMHLLAISGLHVGMLALFCLLLFSFLLRRFPALLHTVSLWKAVAVLSLAPLTL